MVSAIVDRSVGICPANTVFLPRVDQVLKIFGRSAAKDCRAAISLLPFAYKAGPRQNSPVPKFTGVLLGEVPARRVPVSAFCRYRVSLQRKKCCQQIIGLNDESFSVPVCIDAKKKPVLGEIFGDAVRPAQCAYRAAYLPVLHCDTAVRPIVVRNARSVRASISIGSSLSGCASTCCAISRKSASIR